MSRLPTAVLGRTGLEVTRLGYGAALYRWEKPGWTRDRAVGLYNSVVDAGINFIDTAYDYVFAEEWIGEILSPRYGEIHLATKGGCTDSRPEKNSSEHEWTRDNLFRGLETSLRRLRRDSVEVLQLHNPTVEECESGGLAEAMIEMKAQGLVEWIGVSTELPDLPRFLEWGVFDVMQVPYSALERKHEDWIARAADEGVGIIIRGGVAQGQSGVGRGSEERWRLFEDAGLHELLEEGESPSAFVSEVHSDPSGDPHDHRGNDEAGAPGGEPGRRDEGAACGRRIRGGEEAARLGRGAGGTRGRLGKAGLKPAPTN